MAPLDPAREESAVDLTHRGMDFIKAGRYDEALAVSDRLREVRYSSAFEIAALALAGRGELERAVEVLEEGTTKAPDVWLNWQLLGNYRSDLERYEAAQEAYQHALSCPNVDVSSVHLNRAIVGERVSKPAEALSLLMEIVDPALKYRVARVKGRVLRDLGRTEEAWDAVISALDSISEVPADCDLETFDSLTALAGRLMLDSGEQPDGVRKVLVESLSAAPAREGVLSVIREIDDRTSLNAKYYRLLIHCAASDIAQSDDATGAFIAADVIADSPEEALSFVRQIEATAESWKWEIEESDALEERPLELKGVYRITRHEYSEASED